MHKVHYGDLPVDSLLPHFFDTVDVTNGASITLTGLATADIEVYKNVSMTQRASDSGYTLLDGDGIDLDGRVGVHGFSLDLSDDDDPGFYSAGDFYTVVVDAVTVNGQTVRFVACSFSIAMVSVEIAAAVWDKVLTGATHNIATSAGRRLRVMQDFQGYQDAAVWIDTLNGVAGTADFENGTPANPVDNLPDALTIAASVGLSRFRVAPGSSITLAAALTNQLMLGAVWDLDLNGQEITNSFFAGATVSGIGTTVGGEQFFSQCRINGLTMPANTHIHESAMRGPLALGEAGDYFIDRCHSAVAGTGAPVLDWGAGLNASNVSVRNYSGGWEIHNMGAGVGQYNMSLEGRGQLIINANCSAESLVAIRGLFTVTDNAGGAVTLSQDARYDTGQIEAAVAAATASRVPKWGQNISRS